MSAVDPTVLRKLHDDLGGDDEVTRELIDTFTGEAPRMVQTMQEALVSGKRRDLYRAVHSLKSTAATFGAMRLSQLCRSLEADSEREMPADAAERVARVAAEWAIVAGELEKLRP